MNDYLQMIAHKVIGESPVGTAAPYYDELLGQAVLLAREESQLLRGMKDRVPSPPLLEACFLK